MNNPIKKRIIKIYNKIISISQKGGDAYLTYYNYIDDLVNNGEWSILQDVFLEYFKTDIRKWTSVSGMKQDTWEIVSSNTDTTFMNRLKTYYDQKGVYQIGQKIFQTISPTASQFLGKFIEIKRTGEINFNGITYSYHTKFDFYNSTDLYQLSSVDATKSNNAGIKGINYDIILQVQTGTSSYFLADPTSSLLDKYKQGINLLL